MCRGEIFRAGYPAGVSSSQIEQIFSALHQRAVTYASATASTGAGKPARAGEESLRRARRSSWSRMALSNADKLVVVAALGRISHDASSAARPLIPCPPSDG